MAELSKKEMLDVIQYGFIWHSKRIKEELEKIVSTSSYSYLVIEWRDEDDGYFYIYEDECYLFIEDEKIELRCDRNNDYVLSSYKVDSLSNVEAVFQKYTILLEGLDPDF